MTTTTPETLEFKAELKQLLHLITHSLYSDREIFLRELISNASDAIHKIKYNSLDQEERLEGNKDWKITLIPDPQARTLTIRDNGIGMTRAEVVDCLGTVAKSGTKAFLQALQQQPKTDLPGLIGQFGVGFYSAFMVADQVTVVTRPARMDTASPTPEGVTPEATRWVSDGQGTYTLEPADRADRGTDVVLHLKEDAQEFLNPWRIRTIVKKFSDFLEHPVELLTTETKDDRTETKSEILNDRKAIWLRTPKEVTEAEYTEFYQSISRDFEAPLKTLHWSTEIKSEFRALVFIPKNKPFQFDQDDQQHGLRLYVQRVLIMERCQDVLPVYLRFAKGVIDSVDLPLNVSREILQQNPHLEIIRKNVVRNILGGLEGLKNLEPQKYEGFFQEFGTTLKEGLARDRDNQQKVADLLLYRHAQGTTESWTTLADYVAKMPEGQDKIYYLTGESLEVLRNSPYLERFRKRGYDVLLMTDPVDEFVLPYLQEFQGKALARADQADLAAREDEVSGEVAAGFANLLGFLRGHLSDVSDIRLTRRLTDSAACLVIEGGMSAYMERLLKRGGEAPTPAKRILELNPDHPTLVALKTRHALTPEDPLLPTYAQLLYDQAVIAEGGRILDPVAFAKRINDLIAKN